MLTQHKNMASVFIITLFMWTLDFWSGIAKVQLFWCHVKLALFLSKVWSLTVGCGFSITPLHKWLLLICNV